VIVPTERLRFGGLV